MPTEHVHASPHNGNREPEGEIRSDNLGGSKIRQAKQRHSSERTCSGRRKSNLSADRKHDAADQL
jgi:hypothetical protein